MLCRFQSRVEVLRQLEDGAGWQCRLANGTSVEAQSIVGDLAPAPAMTKA